MTFDLPFVEDGRRAQRLAKQVLQRHQFRGQLSAEFSAKALGCDVGDIVQVSLDALGFNNKPFRVVSKEVRPDGRVPLGLLEESQLIYQWDKDDLAPVVPRTPVVYDPLLNMITQGDDAVQAIADGKVTTFYSPTPPVAEGLGDLWYDTSAGLLYRWDGTNWTNQLATWSTPAIANNAITDVTAIDVAPTVYEPATVPAIAGSYVVSKPANTTFIRVTAVGTMQVYDLISGPHDINVEYRLRANSVIYRNTSFAVTVPTGFPLRRRSDFSMVYVFENADLNNGDVIDIEISILTGTQAPRASFETTQIIVEYIKR
jgi:hypothetical protein